MAGKFNAQEVHIEIKNLGQKYRDEKKKMGPSGGSPSQWKHFLAVHQIIGSTAANNAEFIESFSLDSASGSCQSWSLPVSQPLPSSGSESLPSPGSQDPPSPASQPLPSPISRPLPSPVSQPLPSSPLSLLDTPSTSAAAASSSSAKKRNHLGEIVKVMKEQNAMLKGVVEDNQSLTNEIVNAIREQN